MRWWHFGGRLVRGFWWSYLILYNLPVVLAFFQLDKLYTQMWHPLVPWVGSHVLHLAKPITVFPNGSGDTTYNYVEFFCFLILAALLAPLWAFGYKRGQSDVTTPEGIRIMVRYVLGLTMVSYGMSKVFKLQFPFPSPMDLQQSYGDSSPMTLLWIFMGYSTPYTVFAGLGEVLGGCLLFFRRTTTLGALVVAGVMLNVVMLNFSYDVPVKLYSCHLLLMAIWLILPDARRLADVLIFHRPTTPASIEPPFRSTRLRRGRIVAKTLVIGGILALNAFNYYPRWQKDGDQAPKPPFYGLYDLEPAALEDQWQQLYVSHQDWVAVKTARKSWLYYHSHAEPIQHRLVLSNKVKDQRLILTFSPPGADVLTIQPAPASKALTVKLRRVDETKYRLVSRGFHWINEYPFAQ